MSSQLLASEVTLRGRIYHETYGCQMNVNDMEIVLSIMKNAGYNEVVNDPESAGDHFYQHLCYKGQCGTKGVAEAQLLLVS